MLESLLPAIEGVARSAASRLPCRQSEREEEAVLSLTLDATFSPSEIAHSLLLINSSLSPLAS